MLDNTRLISHRIDHMRLRNLSPRTLEVNRNTLRRLARWLEPTPLAEATEDDLNQWAMSLERLAPRSRYASLSRVTCFYGWCHDAGLLDANPARKLPRPKVPRSVPRPIPEQRLAEALADAPADIYCFLLLAAFQGLRRCEVASLQRDSIRDDNDPPVLIVMGKGAKERVVPLHPVVWEALQAYGLPRRGPVFRRRDGQHGAPSAHAVGLLANRYLHDQGIPETFHTLRHRAITVLYGLCLDIRVAQTFAGHSSPQTTAGYTAYSPDVMNKAVLAIPSPRLILGLAPA